MSQEPLPFEIDKGRKSDGFYDTAFAATFTTKCGFNFDFVDRKALARGETSILPQAHV